MTTTPQEVPLHSIDRTPEYEEFMTKLQEFHEKRGTILDPEPKVGLIYLDLYKVFNHVVASGGYDKISEEKLAWRRVAAELGLHSNNEASTAFSLKEKFYKNLAAYEIKTVHNKEPPPKEILEDITAKGASLLTRTLENFRPKRDSNVNAGDSAASGDDGTPTRERSAPEAPSSSRASRGLREAPPQRVIFQPDTGPSLSFNGIVCLIGRLSLTPQAVSQCSQAVSDTKPKLEFLQLAGYLTIRDVAGFDGPNIYTRCLNALRSGVPSEQAFALNHLVKISFERGDKYRFDAFPGLAEGLVDKGLEVGSLFYHVCWTVVWDPYADSGGIGSLDGNNGTPDILDRIANLVEKDLPDALQTEAHTDQMVLITEAVLTLRNMVTLPENAVNMSDFYPIKDLICIIVHLPAKDCLTELKHMALDIAEQITPFMALDSDDPLYKTLLEQLSSDDRGTILTSLRALGRISMNLEATNQLSNVPAESLQRITNWLLLNDDELMDACLDLLYQYTAVVSNVDNLVRSTTPENLVDHLVRLLAHGARKVHRDFILAPEKKLPARDEIAPMPEDLLQQMIKLEEPDRVHKWVKCFFEEDNDSFVTQLAAWQAYQSAFVGPLKAIGQPMITPADFIRNSTSVYKDSNAQVLREPGESQQKFIIHGIRARPRPLNFEDAEYVRCLWATNPEKRNEKCGQFFLKPEQMWNHIMTKHLDEQANEGGQFSNKERKFVCTWGECSKYAAPTSLHLQDFARHVNTHIMATVPNDTNNSQKSWVVPAKTMAVTYEETMTVRDERNPNLPPQAAGIPLSAVLVLRNIARNVVKTEAEEELLKMQEPNSSEKGGWNEKLFRAVLPRLFEVLAENRALGPYISSLLDLIRPKTQPGDEEEY
ncbi:Chromatin structure-remodeling complex subunit rsc9 [Metarhizium anisopliae]|nr:Chromatin structure-remodeling complex subunit rsc9 [Metarhizium anisopliae]